MRLGLIGFGNIATTLLGLLAEGAPLEHLTVLVLPEVAPDARLPPAMQQAACTRRRSVSHMPSASIQRSSTWTRWFTIPITGISRSPSGTSPAL